MSFVHLHTHTQYSLLDGSNKIKEYVHRVKEMGMNAAAITDHGVMYGVIEFYRAAKEAGINPVLGCECYVAPKSRFEREQSHGEDRYYHLILLAENNTGYANLMKIVSKGFVDGYYYKPRIDRELLERYHEGIICLSACLAGEVARLLARNEYEEAKKTALWYRDTFGKDNYFLEMQDHGIPEQKTVNQGLLRLHEETKIDLVVTNDCHYTRQEDADAHDILLCIQTGKKVTDEDRMRYTGGQYYVKSEEEMLTLFPYAKTAIENTQKIADRCHVEIEFGVTKLPHYEVPEGYDSWSYLNKLCSDGLTRRYGERAETLRPQLDYELSVIKKMGYVDYFLIVWDFINFARTHDIPVGPGRGSAAGSLVSYTTGITNIDPERYQLLFERFLNPERVSMPDIDVDFDYERRTEVIDYVIRKYGKDCVTQIVTFGTMAARGVIRDVGRVLDLSYSFVDTIAKSIPNELNITIDRALVMNPDLKSMYEADETVKNLIDTAKKLEGLPRHTSMHAAGVVISQKPMDEYVPLSRASDGTIVTQFTMTTIEELGLLKMDFLGLRTLTVISDAVKLIKKDTGISLDMDQIDYDDRKVLDMICTGKTEGVFQLESAGMKGFMKELKPQSLEDIIAGISLYRPGPMDFIPAYIKGKNHPDEVEYDCPQLKPILEPTYGCIVYQEQVMQIVQNLAGYSLGRADLVRRAMSKKKQAVMEQEREYFVHGNPSENVPGCVQNQIAEPVANKIFDDMIDFAKYAFNKSHAASYAVVAMQTAFLKYYYPVEFMAALMTSVIDNSGKVSEYIAVCRAMGIAVLPPDVNAGMGKFAVDQGKIRYGMYAIRSVGRPVIDAIVEERNKNGDFKTLENFITRMDSSFLNKRAIENLIKAGALDGMDGNRRQMTLIYPSIVDELSSRKKHSMAGQLSLFDIAPEETKKEFEIHMPAVEEFPKELLLQFEKEVLGIYISGHPLEDYEQRMQKNVTVTAGDFVMDMEQESAPIGEDGTKNVKLADGQNVIIGGMITEKNIKFTKKNQPMAFLTIEDLIGTVEVIVFPQTFARYREILTEDAKIFISGHVSADEEKDAKLIADEIVSFEDTAKEVWIQFETMEEFEQKEPLLQKILLQSEGRDSVIIYVRERKIIKKLPPNQKISATKALLDELNATFCEKNVKVIEKNVEFAHKRY